MNMAEGLNGCNPRDKIATDYQAETRPAIFAKIADQTANVETMVDVNQHRRAKPLRLGRSNGTGQPIPAGRNIKQWLLTGFGFRERETSLGRTWTAEAFRYIT